MHEACAGRVLAGVLERVHERPPHCEPVDDVRVSLARRTAGAMRPRVASMIFLASFIPGRFACVVALVLVRGGDDPVQVGAVLAGGEQEDAVRRDVVDERQRAPADSRPADERLDGGRRRREDHERVGAVAAHGDHVGGNHLRGVADVVGLGVDDLVLVLAESCLQAVEVVRAVGVVLVEDADLRLRLVPEDVLRVDLRLARVVRLPAERPGLCRLRGRALVVGALAPVGIAGGDEHLRDLPLVEVVPGREDRRGAEAADDGEDMILLDELLGLGRGLGRVVLVVEGDVLDLAVEDASLGVDVGVVRLLGRRDRLVQLRRPGVRERAADHDLVFRHARRALCARPRAALTATAVASSAQSSAPSFLRLTAISSPSESCDCVHRDDFPASLMEIDSRFKHGGASESARSGRRNRPEAGA